MSIEAESIIKVLSAFSVFALSISFAVVPYKVKAFRENLKVVELANSFAGGLFLTLGMAHILPEASFEFVNYYKAKGKEYSDQFPWVYVCVLSSYFLILFLEKIFFKNFHVPHGSHQSDHRHPYGGIPRDLEEGTPTIDTSNTDGSERGGITKERAEAVKGKEETLSGYDAFSKDTGVILMIGLSFHGLFEGMALGLQTSVASTISLFIGIFVHKWAESLALGIAFLNSKTPVRRVIVMMIAFCSMTPLGIFLGLLISGYNPIFSGIFNAMAVGTFLYISTEELIHEGFENGKNSGLKYLFVLLGFFFVMLINVIELFTKE